MKEIFSMTKEVTSGITAGSLVSVTEAYNGLMLTGIRRTAEDQIATKSILFSKEACVVLCEILNLWRQSNDPT